MTGQAIGYIRVSSTDQNSARQLDGVTLDRIFEDKASGSSADRPKLKECLAYLRDGDTLHVHSIDRLARNLADLQNIVDDLVGRGVAVEFHKENLRFVGGDNPMQTLMLQMLGAFAQFERALIRSRQQEGIAAALAAGKKLGRKPALSDAQVREAKQRRASGESVISLSKAFGISRASMYVNLGESNHAPK